MKIITGNPGTGKHTIAKIIAQKTGLELVDINKIAIDKKLYKNNRGTLDVDTAKLRKIIDKDVPRNCILVGHLAPYAVSPRNVETAIVLRKSPYKLGAIYKKRKYTDRKALENLGSEILGITYNDSVHEFGSKKTFQVDTSTRTIASTAKKVESILNGSKKGDAIDWLPLVLKKGDMPKFFPY